MHANAACLPPPLPAPPAYRCHLPIATAATCLMLLSATCLSPPPACCRRLLYPCTTRGPSLPWPACQPLLTAACTCYLLPAATACLPLTPAARCPHSLPSLQPASSCHLPPPPASAVCLRFLPPPPATAAAASCCRLPAVCQGLPACRPSCLRPTAFCRRRLLPPRTARLPCLWLHDCQPLLTTACPRCCLLPLPPAFASCRGCLLLPTTTASLPNLSANPACRRPPSLPVSPCLRLPARTPCRRLPVPTAATCRHHHHLPTVAACSPLPTLPVCPCCPLPATARCRFLTTAACCRLPLPATVAHHHRIPTTAASQQLQFPPS
ncbi:hypothetical protein GH733_016336 [Mirounga leonina]|nr:hypothetical protein GH733_016336 [Mirounga leonina]